MDIKILNVQDNGDSNFLVYGYMNRGEHEGEAGVSLCRYSYADNKVEERLYIPVDIPYDILSQNIGNVAYLSDENTFYILMDDTLYSVDLVSKEVMTVVSDLVDGTYAVSEDGSAIAYSLNGKPYATESIRVFNMADSSEHIIQADSGDYIKCLGEDPSRVVVDEMVGVWIPLLAVPDNDRWYWYVIAAFALFRIFDIVKPLGVRKMENFKGGVGVMMDDVLAGVYSFILIAVARWVIG